MDGVNLMGLVDLLGVYPPLLGEYPPSLALADYWSHLVMGFTPLPGVRPLSLALADFAQNPKTHKGK